LLLGASACQPDVSNPNIPEEIEGWSPVYAPNAYSIQSSTPKAIEKGGKIYVKGNLLFQIETNKGIHVIDISHPDAPKKLSFIEVAGTMEMAAKENYIYTNNLNDMVILDISNIDDIKVANRVKSAFHMIDQDLPPETGYFECVDASKGIVTGWEKKTLKKPECVR
jgi:hypothetical protein